MSRPKQGRSAFGGTAVSAAGVGAALGVWEVLAHWGVLNRVLTSSPSRIAVAFGAMLQDPLLADDFLTTTRSFAISLGCALMLGVIVGATLAYSRLAYQLANPFVVALNALPKVVLMPIVIMWVGIGATSHVVLGTLMASFPILTSTYAAVRSLDADAIMVGRAFGASRMKMWRSIVLPSIAPYLLGGMRVGLNYAMVGVLIGEFFASSEGLGYRMVVTMSNFQVDQFFVCLVIVAAVAVGGASLLHALERRFGGFRPPAFGGRQMSYQ